MSRLILNATATPPPPAVGKISLFLDTTDGRVKGIDGAGVISALSETSGRNDLQNSGFDFAQRQVLTTVTTYSSVGGRVYGADRWWMSNENASIDYAAVDTATTPEAGLQARFYGRIRKITALGKFAFGQVIEGTNTMPLRGRVVRVSVKMRYSPNPMTVKLGLVQLQNAGTIDTVPSGAGLYITAWGAAGTDPTLGANLAYIAPSIADGGAIVGNGMECVLTAAFVRYSATFVVPANCKNLIPTVWTRNQPAINDMVQFSEFQMSDGYEILDYTPRLVADILPMLQRYYYKTFPILIAPAQNAGLANASIAHAVAGAVAAVFGVCYPTTMRAAPTLTYFNPSAANALTRNILKATDATVTSTNANSEAGVVVNVTGPAGWVAGDGIAIHITADAEL